eukprot:10206351-Prorocentrum_lima.AAC.1
MATFILMDFRTSVLCVCACCRKVQGAFVSDAAALAPATSHAWWKQWMQYACSKEGKMAFRFLRVADVWHPNT